MCIKIQQVCQTISSVIGIILYFKKCSIVYLKTLFLFENYQSYTIQKLINWIWIPSIRCSSTAVLQAAEIEKKERRLPKKKGLTTSKNLQKCIICSKMSVWGFYWTLNLHFYSVGKVCLATEVKLIKLDTYYPLKTQRLFIAFGPRWNKCP